MKLNAVISNNFLWVSQLILIFSYIFLITTITYIIGN